MSSISNSVGGTHRMDVRVYYHDTDAGGVVYHGAYLDYAERARTEFLRDLGYHHVDLRASENVIFVVRHIDIDYLIPGRLDDELVMETTLSSLKNTSFVMNQTVKRGDEILARMDVVIVCIDVDVVKPVKIPQSLKAALENDFEQKVT